MNVLSTHVSCASLNSRSSDQERFRVAVIGNQGAYGYRICEWMRRCDQPAELFLIRGKDKHERDQIASLSRQQDDESSPWIHTYAPFDTRFASLHEEFDVALTLGPSGLKTVCRLGDIPVVHFAMGSDVWEMPFHYIPPHTAAMRAVDRVRYRIMPAARRSKRSIALDARASLSRSRAVISTVEEVSRAVWELGLQDKLRVWPFPQDVHGNRQLVDNELLAELNGQYARYHRVFMWLSRLNFVDKRKGSYKGADNFLYGIKALLDYEPLSQDVRVVVGLHGDDPEAFQELAGQLGLTQHIDYVTHLPFWKLITYLALPNAVVCDQLHRRDCITGLVRESLSMGTPVVMGVDQQFMRICYGSPLPVQIAIDAESCATAFRESCRISNDEFRAQQLAIRQWADTHLDFSIIIPRLIQLLRETAFFDSRKRAGCRTFG